MTMTLLALLLGLFCITEGISYYAWHGASLTQHLNNHALHFGNGYRYISLSIHGDPSSPLYTAVVVYNPTLQQKPYFSINGPTAWQSVFDSMANSSYGPSIVVATGGASSAKFAAIFEPGSPAYTRHGLKNGDSATSGTIQYENKLAATRGDIPSWIAIYGDASDPRYIAIWRPHKKIPGTTIPDTVIWNADGVLETGAQYQARFNAQTSGWCRPALVALNEGIRYFSVFVDDSIGPWVARHGLTAAEYQAEFDAQGKAGFYPFLVQGGGTGSSTRYAALWAKSTTPVPKAFSVKVPTGASPRAAIDNVVKAGLLGSPVRHASLAIVYQDKLVYTAGYTWGEPNWPLADPTTRFRLASVSKTVVALGIYQLLEIGTLKLTDKVQAILNWKTPSGNSPADARFSTITVQHLLEHKSGLNPNAFSDDSAVLQAHKAAGGSWNFPVTETMIDSYIAGLSLTANPGGSIVYNNCGYYVLGRVLAKKRNEYYTGDALKYLYKPLNITRIRPSPDSLQTMPSDEARYRAHDIPVYSSVLDSAQLLVPNGYGNGGRLLTRIGAGGLSGAATDMARLLALLTTKADSPALKRATISQYVKQAAAISASGGSRAGYGYDYAANLGNDSYYVQKGGSLATSGNVFEVSGDWAFVMQWAGLATAATNWYPDYPGVMNAAKTINWNVDLFPQFGL